MFNLSLISFLFISVCVQNVFPNTKKKLIIRFAVNESQVFDTTLLKNELEEQLSSVFQIYFHQNQFKNYETENIKTEINGSLTFEKIQKTSQANINAKNSQSREPKLSKKTKMNSKIKITIPEIHTLEELSNISKALGHEPKELRELDATRTAHQKKIFKDLNISIEESNFILSKGASILLIIDGFRNTEKINSTKTKFFKGSSRQILSELDFTLASIATDKILRKDKISVTKTILSGKSETSPKVAEETNPMFDDIVKKLAKSINETLETKNRRLKP